MSNDIESATLPPFLPVGKKYTVNKQDSGADRYCRIRDVEGRPVPLTVIPLDKIHHMTISDAIDHIADRAAQYQSERGRGPLLVIVQAFEPDNDRDAHGNRQHDKKPALPALRVAQKTERRPGVMYERQVEPGKHRISLVRLHPRACHPLGDLVKEDN